MDTVAQSLSDSVMALESRNLKYVIQMTKPTHDRNRLDIDELFVIRQKIIDGVYQLVVAAKMI
jgi:hypothetical protein